MDGLLSVRGIVEIAEADDDEAAVAAACAGALASLEEALASLGEVRRAEGEALASLLRERLDAIERLTLAADANPAAASGGGQGAACRKRRDADGGRARLRREPAAPGGDPLAAKADIREELDRLKTHVAAARALIDEGGAIGRRLDFLAQEFGREANTLCSKANDVTLTPQGLELRAQIEQFREQAQNVE